MRLQFPHDSRPILADLEAATLNDDLVVGIQARKTAGLSEDV